jgi:hypothetical protein
VRLVMNFPAVLAQGCVRIVEAASSFLLRFPATNLTLALPHQGHLILPRQGHLSIAQRFIAGTECLACQSVP